MLHFAQQNRRGAKEGHKGGKRERGSRGPMKHLPDGPVPFWLNILSSLLLFALLISAYAYFSQQEKPEEVALSQLAADVKAELVEGITVEGEKLRVAYADDVEKLSKKEAGTALSETLANYGVTPEELGSIEITIENPSGFLYWLGTIGPFLIPLVFLLVLFWFLMRQVRGAGMQAFTFGQSKARMIDPEDERKRVTFADVAGSEEAKQELVEVVDFLKHPKKYINIGAEIPKGVLLMGPPGSGKTLLARAVAGEAGVPFFSISGSEFVEMFVGVGASRVRDLFKMAKKTAPSIIFVDEIDAVGRIRGAGMGGGNDEREQTLNQILVEMDGFEPNEKVIVLAATNRPDVLDPALQRPGRFDRRVMVDLPDRKEREAILAIHARKKPLAKDVNLGVIAERTPGFSGADLYSLMNEAAILAARNNRKKLQQSDLIQSIEKVMLGPERRSFVMTPHEKRITAYHEAGHALVASVLEHADPVHKISIVARGHAGGYTLKLPFDEKRYHSRNEFLDDIAVSLGGYVAERTIFEDVTTGASNDLQVLTARARAMVTKYGMSEKLGPMSFGAEAGRQPFYGEGVQQEYSERVASEIDEEVSAIVSDAFKRVEEIMRDKRDVLESIARTLIEVETLEREEFEALLREHSIEPKQKEDDTAGKEQKTHPQS